MNLNKTVYQLLEMRWILNYKNGKGPKRVNYASVSIDKYILIFGGYCEELIEELSKPIDCLEFDTSTLKWRRRPTPEINSPQWTQTPCFRYGHTCVIYNSHVILWGGSTDWSRDICNLIYKYDPSKAGFYFYHLLTK